jgi:ATP-dependent Lhr-like helicase
VKELSAFKNIRGRQLDVLLQFLMDSGILVSDGDMVMPGPGAEQTFGRSNWKDLFSVISGGSEFRAVTPDGEVVGTIDARFAAGKSGRSFSLGGKNWTFLKSDDSHELVLVVPGEGGKNEIFWTGGQAGFSPIVCRAVGRIISEGRSVLPLPEPVKDHISGLLETLPPMIPGGLYVMEKPGNRGPDVAILTFRGRMFNGILAALIRAGADRKLAVSHHDFSVSVKNAGKVNAASRVYNLLLKLQRRNSDEGARGLKIPGPETWKFAGMLPPRFLEEMTLDDYYHYQEFFRDFAGSEIILNASHGSEIPGDEGIM